MINHKDLVIGEKYLLEHLGRKFVCTFVEFRINPLLSDRAIFIEDYNNMTWYVPFVNDIDIIHLSSLESALW